MKIKKIFFVVSRMHGGGAQRVILNILNFLAQRKEFEVHLILYQSQPEDSYLQFVDSQCQIHVLQSTAKFGWFKLNKLIRQENPDVILSTLNYINISTALATSISRTKAKLIVREARTLAKSSKLINTLQRLVYNRVNLFWAITPDIEEELKKILKVSSTQIALAPNPTILKNTIEKANREEVQINQNDPVRLLYVGRLIALKNIDSLIKALSLISELNWSLEIVGDGPLRSSLEKTVLNHNLAGKITFVGYSKNPYQYMLSSDIFCFPSKWEGFPNVVVEALACGNLCIANDTYGGGVRFIKSLVDTVIVENYDQPEKIAELIAYYIDNRKKLSNIKTKSSSLAEQFEMDNYYENYLKKMLS